MKDLLYEIPKLYTALAQWLACLIYIIPLKKRIKKEWLVTVLAVGLLVQIGINYVAGIMHPRIWLGFMFLAFLGMCLLLFTCLEVSLTEMGFLVIRAFIVAEFAASLEWQIFFFLAEMGLATRASANLCLVLIYSFVFISLFFIEKRHLPTTERLRVRPKELWNSALIGGAVFLMSNLSFLHGNTPFSSTMEREIFYIRTLVDFVGVVMLYAQLEMRREADLRHELAAMDSVLHKQYEIYRISKENDELINRKYHDLKHQIQVIRQESDPEKREAYLKEMDSAIRKHQAENRTGNNVLDTILFGKALYCAENEINFTCVADGKLLNFMEVMDICTIFGNALDNAIESVEKIKDTDKRLISMNVSAQNSFVLIRFDNYFESKIKMEEGMPLTTKKDAKNHGYGIKSIRLTAEKYGGSATVHTQDKWFSLLVLLPLPETQ